MNPILKTCLCFFFHCVLLIGNEDTYLKKANAYMILRDFESAQYHLEKEVSLHPQDFQIKRLYLKLLAGKGDERQMMKLWDQWVIKYPQLAQDHEILESLAWGILQQTPDSRNPIIRVFGILGAILAQDHKSVSILNQGLHDSNSAIRSISAQLTCYLRDDLLKQELLTTLKNEPIEKVRLSILKALGTMKVHEAKQMLVSIIKDDTKSDLEMAAAVESLAGLNDQVTNEQLLQLVNHQKSGLRLLACTLMLLHPETTHLEIAAQLLNDQRCNIRMQAIKVLGNHHKELKKKTDKFMPLIQNLKSDPNFKVRIYAAWLMTLLSPSDGLEFFSTLLQQLTDPIRKAYVVSALSSSGVNALPLLKKIFDEEDNPYVRLNASFGLIYQRAANKSVMDYLYHEVTQNRQKWMWEDEDSFRVLLPSTLKHTPEIPNLPEAKNQLVRLEILNALTYLKHSQAQDAIKTFLLERQWGISGIASLILLTEGPAETLDLIENLLQEINPRIRIQASLILAHWGRTDKALPILINAYPTADREIKEKILESLGQYGESIVIPFLVEKLKEPYQTLRILAASSLLRCLYN